MISAANRIAQLTDDDKHAVEVVYLTVFSRKPSEKEQEHFVARLQEEKSMQFRTRTVEDMIWILLNSTEFSWNH
jgi:citrate synthase